MYKGGYFGGDLGPEYVFVNPEHERLFKAMMRVEETIAKKGLDQYKDENGEWQSESPTMKAIMNKKPSDYYWSERFKGFQNWPRRRATEKETKQILSQRAKQDRKAEEAKDE